MILELKRSFVEKKFSVKRGIKARIILKLEKMSDIESERTKFEVFLSEEED